MSKICLILHNFIEKLAFLPYQL